MSTLDQRRQFIVAAASLAATAMPATSWALCASPKEGGRWKNILATGDPAFLDIALVDCGDQVLNGQQTQTRYALKVWVRQSTGKLYGRPKVNASFRTSKGVNWLYARVSTGGYLDHYWMALRDRAGQPHLQVLIKHESLDSKPSASSEHWFSHTA